MSNHVVETWKCDFCGKEVKTGGGAPEHWRQVAIGIKSIHVESKYAWSPLESLHACRSCIDPGFDRKTQVAGRIRLLLKALKFWGPGKHLSDKEAS